MTTKLPPLNKMLNELQYQVMNPIHNAYKNTVPANMRVAIKSVVNPNAITEANFNAKELNTLQNIYNRNQARVNSPQNRTQQQYIDNLLQQKWNNVTRGEYPQVQSSKSKTQNMFVPNNLNNVANMANSFSDDAIYDMAQDLIKKGVQYSDYNTDTAIKNIGNNALVRSYTEPDYAMATLIGRASVGNNTINDIYDFNKINGRQVITPKGNNDSAYLWLRNNVLPKYSQNMPVNINLGRVK